MKRTAEIIREIYQLVDELETIYPGRKFTPDGHLVGSIGEAYAAAYYGLTLLPASASTHDAVDAGGRLYQIKATGGTGIGIRSCPDNLLVLKLHRDGTLTEVYNGTGQPAWDAAGAMQKNGQRAISLSKLRGIGAARIENKLV
jgi:hypothetical protein